MTYFVCAHCGALVNDLVSDQLDSGTELVCPACGEVTVILLLTPAEYVEKVRV
jgi:DNA-directed RNA polymerase subunit RPC12/RpoP